MSCYVNSIRVFHLSVLWASLRSMTELNVFDWVRKPNVIRWLRCDTLGVTNAMAGEQETYPTEITRKCKKSFGKICERRKKILNVGLKGQVHGSAHAHLSKCCFSAGKCCIVYASMIWSCQNVVKEPICTLPWQSLVLDQLKYLQIAVN